MPTPLGYGLDDLNDPHIDPGLLQVIQTSPQIQQLMHANGSGTVDFPNKHITVTNGRVTGITGGSAWGPILAALAVGTGGILAPVAAAALSGDAAAGAAGAGGAASALGPTSAATMAATTAATAAPAGIAASTLPAVAGAVAPAVAGSIGGVPYGSLINAGVGLFGSLFGAKMQSDSAASALAAETASQKYAADLQSQATANALAFQKSSAENAFQNNEASRQGNYGQYAATQRRLGSIGDLIGAGPREIPAYVPGVDPQFTASSGATASPTGAPTSPTASSAPGDLTSMLTSNYQKLGVAPTGRGTGPTDLAYYADQITKTGGLTPQNTAYWFGPQGRIAQDLAKANGGGSSAPTAPPIGSVSSYLGAATPYAPVPMAASLTMPGSVGSYLGS